MLNTVGGAGIVCWLERRTLDRKVASLNRAGAVGEFSSPELTFCADSYSVSDPPPCYRMARKRPRLLCQKCRWQVTPTHAYTLDPTKLEWADYAAVQAIVWEPIRKRAHKKFVREHSATVVAAR